MTVSSMSKSIVFLGHAAFDQIGGMQQFNRRVIKALAAIAARHSGFKVTALLLGDRRRVHRVGTVEVEGFGKDRVAFLRRFAEIAAHPPDLLLNGYINLFPLAAALKALRPKCRQVLFVHGIEVWGEPKYRRLKPFEAWSVRFSTDVVAGVSRYTIGKMAAAYDLDPERFTLFPNAVDLAEEAAPPRPFWRSLGRAPRLLSVGRLDPLEVDKGFPTVLRSLVLLRTRYPDLRYAIVGDGSIRPLLEAMATELGVADMVDFLGRLSDEARTTQYNEADIFVLPSKKEGFGIVFLEAWQHGLPIVCGNKDASPEVVNDGEDGFTVDPDSAEAVASAISKLLDDEALSHRFVEAGLVKTRKFYTNAHFCQNLETLLTAAFRK
jgi:phosphatidylinositol alpha-1,6-mannosyltransferase